VTTDNVGLDQGDSESILGMLARLGAPDSWVDGTPPLLAAGTFAMYPTPTGGIMMVCKVAEGPDHIIGEQRFQIPPAMIRTVGAVMGGGSKMGALKAMMGGRKRRE
jgi:hypothetical protein